MDILRFVNSTAVREHLRNIGHEFTAAQAAYLIDNCRSATIEGKIDAWREIVETMPDCDFLTIVNCHLQNGGSMHEAIRKHIEKTQSDLRAFMDPEDDGKKHLYFPAWSQWKSILNKDDEGNHSWLYEPNKLRSTFGPINNCVLPIPCSTFESCIEYLKEDHSYFGNTYDRHKIIKMQIDDRWHSAHEFVNDIEPVNFSLEWLIVDENYSPMCINMDWYYMGFDYMLPDIPIPFKSGDIVYENRFVPARKPSAFQKPFVYDRCVNWSEEECVSHNGKRRFTYLDDRDCFQAIAERKTDHTIHVDWDIPRAAYGYEVDSYPEDEGQNGKATLRYAGSPVCGNYLDLEYYSNSLSDDFKVLEEVSGMLRKYGTVQHSENFFYPKIDC